MLLICKLHCYKNTFFRKSDLFTIDSGNDLLNKGYALAYQLVIFLEKVYVFLTHYNTFIILNSFRQCSAQNFIFAYYNTDVATSNLLRDFLWFINLTVYCIKHEEIVLLLIQVRRLLAQLVAMKEYYYRQLEISSRCVQHCPYYCIST